MTLYGEACGWVLARRMPDRAMQRDLAGYLGSSDRFDQAIADFAEAYADQNERDYQAFVRAILAEPWWRAGTLPLIGPTAEGRLEIRAHARTGTFAPRYDDCWITAGSPPVLDCSGIRLPVARFLCSATERGGRLPSTLTAERQHAKHSRHRASRNRASRIAGTTGRRPTACQQARRGHPCFAAEPDRTERGQFLSGRNHRRGDAVFGR